MCACQDMLCFIAARLLGNGAQAQDIAQEVFLKTRKVPARLLLEHDP
ncbi:MAG: sigma factor [Steroidobacteraceae bacterium]|jgi:DNA-directed RNA polymerase specialized sigma24 family protein